MSAEQFPLTPAAAKEAQKQYTALANREDELLAEVAKGNFDEAKKLKAELEAGIATLSERLISPVERDIKLKESYDSQVTWLEGTGAIEKMRALGHELPSYEQIRRGLRTHQETLDPKVEQRFKKMIIVPAALEAPERIAAYGDVIKRHYAAGTLKGANGEDLELNEAEPVYLYNEYKDPGKAVYYPKKFHQTNHEGLTKAQCIDQYGAWQVLLVEDEPEIPRQGAGGPPQGGRKRLEANRKPEEYLAELAKGGPYAHEQGLTYEAWLQLAITHLEETGQVLDDYMGGGSACYNLGTYFPASAFVSFCHWARAFQLAFVSYANPDGGNPDRGVRSSVRVELAKGE